MSLYADSILMFAKSDPTPDCATSKVMSSTVVYDREHRHGSMPSLTLGRVRQVCNQPPFTGVIAFGDHAEPVDVLMCNGGKSRMTLSVNGLSM